MKRDWKEESVRHWTAAPCGATSGTRFGTPEFFEEVRRERYGRYAPWLPEAARFSRAEGKDVLEIGFGLGTDLISFARAGAMTFGVDLTPRHTFAARQRFLQEGLPPRLVLGDAERLPFAPRAFDLIYSFGVLHHTPDVAGAVREAHRALRDNGHSWIALYHRHSLFWWYWILFEGVAKLGFLRQGIDETLSRIEFRGGRGAGAPLVRAYGRSEVRAMFRDFHRLSISCHHFGFSESGKLGRMLGPMYAFLGKRLADRWGWYLVVKGER